MVKSEGLHTVCQEAGCPNIFECWEDREATFLIGGEQCTRRCDFCQIDTGRPSRPRPRRAAPGRRVGAADGPALLDHHRRRPRRPRRRRRVALRRDDPPGARAQPRHRRRDPRPRLQRHARAGRPGHRRRAPRCFAHNVETVPRIFKRIRPAFRYERSLEVITMGRDAGLVTKSNLILGMGEEDARDRAGAARPARGRHRHHHHHPVPPALAAPPPRRPLGQAGGVRPLVRGRRRDRVQGRHGRSAGALVLPRRAAVGHRDEALGTPDPRAPGPPGGGRRLPRPPGGGASLVERRRAALTARVS